MCAAAPAAVRHGCARAPVDALDKDESRPIRVRVGQRWSKCRRKGAQKGRRLEEQCKEGLEEATRPYSDAIDPTGDVSGRAGKSKKGDFVATLDGSGKRIVFEMKDVDSIGPTGVRAELKEAMDSRDAAYGVLVARSRASLAGGIGRFNEYDGNILACALGDAEGNPAMDGGMIGVAYRWARARPVRRPGCAASPLVAFA